MNEITNIHLGRQAFTIAIDAHKALRDYLEDIAEAVGGKSDTVMEEIELRMAELLAERGVTGDKVILLADVTYLKEQLGAPKDFKESDDDGEPGSKESAPKRLYRDTDRAVLAGVASGIAAYFDIDPVVPRLLFVLATLVGGWGIALYIVLWLVVPPAKTSSEKLHMRGRAVTAKAIKETVERVDVRGTAERVGKTVGDVLERLFRVILTVIGIGFMIGGAGALFALTTGSIYTALNINHIVPYNIFPQGAGETGILVLLGLMWLVVAIFMLLVGLAMIKRKWQLPGWAVAALIAVFLASGAGSTALIADTTPKVKQRYEALLHKDVREVEPFANVSVINNGQSFVPVSFRKSATYKIELKTFGQAATDRITTKKLGDGTLLIDASNFVADPACGLVCKTRDFDLEIVVYMPELPNEVIDQGFYEYDNFIDNNSVIGAPAVQP